MVVEEYNLKLSGENMTILTLYKPGDAPIKLQLHDGTYTLGSDLNCRIPLKEGTGVCPRHAILNINSGKYQIRDIGDGTAIFVNGEPIDRRADVFSTTPITLGQYTIVISEIPEDDLIEPAPTSQANNIEEEDEEEEISNNIPLACGGQPSDPIIPKKEAPPEPAPIETQPSIEREGDIDPAQIQMMRSIKAQIHAELIDRLDIKRLSASRVDTEELRQRARETLQAIINDVRNRLPSGIDSKLLEQEILNEALGLGPLEDLLADDSVTEIMVNGPDRIFVERSGKLVLSNKTFMDAQSVMSVIERIVAPLGRRVDESQPYVDARLADGSRVNCVIHPLSLIGPCITIRKFAKRQLFDKDLINYGTLTEAMAEFLKVCVKVRKNIVVSGGTGSGKTTLLNVLSNYLPEGERILTIEDAAELRLNQPHLVRLEARPPNIEGRGAITIRDLVRNALRMRPDRIIVGECRGGEALDMLQAMNTGHDGSLTTVHANAPRDVIARLETMVLMSGMELPSRAIREQIASAIDIIVHESRLSDGSRKVTCISEVVGLEGNQITMQDIFEFKQTGISAQGKVIGHYRATGAVPTFFTDLAARGITLDPAIFQP